MSIWDYDNWPSGEPYDWSPAERGDRPHDSYDFHVDLGCGTLKKGRIGIDRYPSPTVDIVADLDHGVFTHAVRDNGRDDYTATTRALPPGYLFGDGRNPAKGDLARVWGETAPWTSCHGLPFEDSSIESMVSHHCFEHIGEGFVDLIEEIYRVLKPDAVLRAITPLFPSISAVGDPDHKRYFTERTWEVFTGKPNEPHWMESFSVPYTNARFELVDSDISPYAEPGRMFADDDHREIRVALKAMK